MFRLFIISLIFIMGCCKEYTRPTYDEIRLQKELNTLKEQLDFYKRDADRAWEVANDLQLKGAECHK